VNGRVIDSPSWTGYRLHLEEGLRRGDNTVRVVYENEYDHTGDGFHQFIDPEDGEEYLYTNFEPYEAHRLFPCFDQPDIKGRYRVEVTAPAAWVTIANTPAVSIDEEGDGRLRHRFAESELFSTYLVAVASGPYVERTTEHRGLKLGLYARRSLEKQLEEHGDKIEASLKSEIETAVAETKSAIESNDVEAMQAKAQALAQVAMKLGQAIYEKEQAAGAAAGGAETGAATGSEAGGEDVVDAEFSEVDDENKG
jgi:ribosomal protein S20